MQPGVNDLMDQIKLKRSSHLMSKDVGQKRQGSGQPDKQQQKEALDKLKAELLSAMDR